MCVLMHVTHQPSINSAAISSSSEFGSSCKGMSTHEVGECLCSTLDDAKTAELMISSISQSSKSNDVSNCDIFDVDDVVVVVVDVCVLFVVVVVMSVVVVVAVVIVVVCDVVCCVGGDVVVDDWFDVCVCLIVNASRIGLFRVVLGVRKVRE